MIINQMGDLSAIEHLNDYTENEDKGKSGLLEHFSKASHASFSDGKNINEMTGSQKSLHMPQPSSLIVAFDDVKLGQRESAPLPAPDQKIGAKEIDLTVANDLSVKHQSHEDEPAVTDFKRANLDFMSKLGRVLSPLEAEDIPQGAADTSLLDLSSLDHL